MKKWIFISSVACITGVCLLLHKPYGKLSCVKDHKVSFCPGISEDVLTVPLVSTAAVEKIPFLEFDACGETWKMTALYSHSVGALLAEFSHNYETPCLAFVQDASGDEYLLTVDKAGQCSLSPLSFLLEHAFLVKKTMRGQSFLGYCPKKNGEVICYFEKAL